jgi:hypothetical protein
MTDSLEIYLRELRDIRASGAGVDELSYYHPLANLLNEHGKTLKPKVRPRKPTWFSRLPGSGEPMCCGRRVKTSTKPCG